jgi:hypothetical protein
MKCISHYQHFNQGYSPTNRAGIFLALRSILPFFHSNSSSDPPNNHTMKYATVEDEEDDSTRVAQFKIEALDWDIAQLAVIHNDVRIKLHRVQERHMERRENIQTLQHNSRKCWDSSIMWLLRPLLSML